jgi:hypothetical protein
MNDDGNFQYDSISDDNGLLAPYAMFIHGVASDKEECFSKWNKFLFDNASTLAKATFTEKLTTVGITDDKMIDSIWLVFGPIGSSTISISDVVTAIKKASKTKYGMTIIEFEEAIAKANSKLSSLQNIEFVDYEGMDILTLQRLITERELKNIPPRKRLMIEELRFFDIHSRQGKRHPVTNILE